MEYDGIKKLLTQVKSIHTRYREISRQSGENFNIFKILQLHTSEVRLHSAFLAELLNPTGSHGQKEIFLKLFIEHCSTPEKFFIAEGAYVEIEKPIGFINNDRTKGGRIDIILTDIKGKHIIIENKIYAADQHNQLVRYKNYSKQSDILYLTLKDDVRPTKASCGFLEENKDYKCISYRTDIAKWIEFCREQVPSNPIVRESLTQYLNLIKYLNNQTTNSAMREELTSVINSNLQAAFIVSGNLKAAQDALLKKLKIDVESLAEGFKVSGYQCKYYVDFSNQYSGFRFIKDGSDLASIAFQFGEFGRFFTYGIALIDADSKPVSREYREILENLVGVESKEAWWPIKLQFEAPYNKNWEVSYEPWEGIESGNLKEIIKKKVEFLIEKLGDIKL